MKCQQFSELLTAFIDDEITGPEMVRLHEHLRDCPSCARRVESLKSVQEMFREEILSLEPVVPPAGFSRKILAGIATSSEAQGKPRPLRRHMNMRAFATYASLIAAAVLLFLFWFLGQGENPRLLPVDKIKIQEAQVPGSGESGIPDDLDEHILAASQNPLTASSGLLAQVSSQE